MTEILRETGETRVRVGLSINGPDPKSRVDTTEPFLDHMLTTLARYAGFDLEVEAEGDLRHHLVEDVGITLGLALLDEIPPTCMRYGTASVVMDDAWVEVALDLGGRFWYEGPLPSKLYDHFLRSLAENAKMTLHLRVVRGDDRHHVVEAGIKAFGLALRCALELGETVFSTKGAVHITRGGEG